MSDTEKGILTPSRGKFATFGLSELPQNGQHPLFPNAAGGFLTRSGIESRLKGAVTKACQTRPSLKNRNVSPHTIRHTTAMHLLQSGVDITVIALWLGHESSATTHMYVEADLEMKQKALDRLEEPGIKPTRFKPSDKLLLFWFSGKRNFGGLVLVSGR